MSPAKLLSSVIPALGTDPSTAPLSDEDLVRAVLEWLGLTQAAVAALLAISPQSVSKSVREQGLHFLGPPDRKSQSLYSALVRIGGDKYLLAASRLREVARVMGWGHLHSPFDGLSQAGDVYASATEMWFVSDAPGASMDWGALRAQIVQPTATEAHKVVVFLARTLEGAERWAEALEREFARPALAGGKLELENAAVSGCYLFVLVCNALSFSQDYLITDPGSPCMGVATAAQAPAAYVWAGNAYATVEAPNLQVVSVLHGVGLGQSATKANFFPKGVPLKQDMLDFKFTFLDSLVAVRGPTSDEDSTPAGDRLVGGVLKSVANRAPQTLAFNRRSKFTPVCLLVYKRRPREGLNRNPSRSIRVLTAELELPQEQGRDEDPRNEQPASFW